MARPLPPFEIARAASAAIRARLLLVAVFVLAAPVVAAVLKVGAPGHRAALTLGFKHFSRSDTLTKLGVAVPPQPSAGLLVAPIVVTQLAAVRALDESTSDLHRRLTVVERPATRQAQLVARSGSDRDARDLVNKWANVVLVYRSQVLKAAIAARERALRSELQGNPGLSSTAQPQLAQLADIRRSGPTDTRVIQGARLLPRATPTSVLLEAAAVGLALGLAVALSIGLIDGRLRTPATASRAFSLPVLGEFGRTKPGPGGSDPDAIAGRMIAARLTALNNGENPKLVLVTSCDSQADADAAASRVAAAFAEQGARAELLIWHEPGADQLAAPGLAAPATPDVDEATSNSSPRAD